MLRILLQLLPERRRIRRHLQKHDLRNPRRALRGLLPSTGPQDRADLRPQRQRKVLQRRPLLQPLLRQQINLPRIREHPPPPPPPAHPTPPPPTPPPTPQPPP